MPMKSTPVTSEVCVDMERSLPDSAPADRRRADSHRPPAAQPDAEGEPALRRAGDGDPLARPAVPSDDGTAREDVERARPRTQARREPDGGCAPSRGWRRRGRGDVLERADVAGRPLRPGDATCVGAWAAVVV